MATLLSDNADYKTKNNSWNKEAHFIMIKRSMHQEDTVILNVYAPNNSTWKYMLWKLIKLQKATDKSAIILGDFGIPLSIIYRTSSRKSVRTQRTRTPSRLDLNDTCETLPTTTNKRSFHVHECHWQRWTIPWAGKEVSNLKDLYLVYP